MFKTGELACILVPTSPYKDSNCMKIFVIRHGETESNQKRLIMGNRIDESLNDKGVEQAEKVARELVAEKFDVIFSSTLKRAQETAEIIKRHVNLPLVIDRRLGERDFGSLSGKNWSQIEKGVSETAHADDRAQRYDYTQFGGESAEDVKQRLLDFLDFLKKEHSSEKILIVAHGGIMKMLQHLYTEEKTFTPENGMLQSFEV